ncbi:glycosyltransferase family 2 protein [Kutzneria kofuensis]|uniref:Glycosyltransferase involved in cell wall biosynthesis n=1 Tax=Kutzneria kofuensis TaxID=103725 RepID=A0A7W9NG83_9PSEU|nr:glycosyltransferase family 2 protein [Kutzneria kofuensis]MBB5891219.1 glycosyltransferase involved in cell wall biosynthesis [Kutzneria kofuensis]
MPLVSVLTPVLADRAELLVEAGKSVAAQELPAGWELEWIVQEDGPSPALRDLVDGFPFARYGANGEPLGVAVTRNLALARAGGELVHVLDSDDLLLPHGLAVAIDAFAQHPDIHWVAGQGDDLLSDGSRRSVQLDLAAGRVERGALTQYFVDHGGVPIHPAGLTLRTVAVRALGGWAASPRSEDVALLVAVADLAPGYLTPAATWLARQHAGQTTRLPNWQALFADADVLIAQRITAQRHAALHYRTPGESRSGAHRM